MEITKERRALIIRARVKLLRLAKKGEPCHPACPGWGVFESGKRGTEIERCDDCWSGFEDKLMDDEAAALPEAQALLKETLTPYTNIGVGGEA